MIFKVINYVQYTIYYIMNTLPCTSVFPRFLLGSCLAQFLIFCVVLWRSLLVFCSFFKPLYCLTFDLWLLITILAYTFLNIIVNNQSTGLPGPGELQTLWYFNCGIIINSTHKFFCLRKNVCVYCTSGNVHLWSILASFVFH
jgi:hypothetical protein